MRARYGHPRLARRMALRMHPGPLQPMDKPHHPHQRNEPQASPRPHDPEENSTDVTLCIACRKCGYYTHNYPRKLAKICNPERALTDMGNRATDFIASNRHPDAHSKKRKNVRVDGPGWLPFERTINRMKDGQPLILDSDDQAQHEESDDQG